MLKKLVVLLPSLLLFCQSALPVSKEIIRLQADVTLLQQQMRDLQKSLDSQGAVMKTLVEQLHDQVAALKRSIEEGKDSNQQTQAAVSAKVESITGQFSTLNSSLDLVLDKIAKLSQQVAEAKAKAEALDTVNPPAGGPGTPPRAAPPSPGQLYDSSYGDYIKGNYDLARQGFEEYVRTYPDTELSDNAQYWIGECYYVQRKFPEGVDAFNKVLELYPKGDKAAAASLKKAYSLLETKNNDAGIKELRTLIQRYPNSDSAQLAKERLTALGVSSGSRPQPARKPVRR